MTDKKGFTLVELLAVITILAVVLLLLVPNILNISRDSKISLRDSKIKTIQVAAEKYGNDEINNYQTCLGTSNSAYLESNCLVGIDYLIDFGYMDGDNDTNTVIDPNSNEPLSGKVLLCYDAYNVNVYASYYEDNNYSCKDISVSGANSLNLSSVGGLGYIGGNDVVVNVLSSGDFSSFSCESSNTSLATCRVSSDNKLLITPGNDYGTVIENGMNYKNVTLTVIGNYRDDEGKAASLKKSYTLKVYPTSLGLSVDSSSSNRVCIERGNTLEVDIFGENYGTLSVNTGNTSIMSGTIKNNVLFVTAGNTAGNTELTLKEANGNNKAIFYGDTYILDLSEMPDDLLVSNSERISIDHAGTGTVTITSSNENVIKVSKSSSGGTKSISLGTSDRAFYLIANEVGTATITIEGADCGLVTKEIIVTNLKLEKESGVIYIGGESLLVPVYTENNAINCRSENTDMAFCAINGTNLVVYPGTKPTGDDYVEIEVFGAQSGRDVFKVSVLETSISILDEDRKNVISKTDAHGNVMHTVCDPLESDETIVLNVDGKNIGNVYYLENNVDESRMFDWYLGEVVTNNENDKTISITKRILERNNVPAGSTFKAGRNAGQAIYNISESNGNKDIDIYYNVYSMDLSENSGTVKVGSEITFDVTTKATGNISVRLSNESVAEVREIKQICSNGEATCDYDWTVNSTNTYRVTIRGKSVGTTNVIVSGSSCGTKEYDLRVIGNTFEVNLKNGSYSSYTATERLTCTTRGSSGTCEVTFPNFTTNNEFVLIGWSTEKDSPIAMYSGGDTYTISASNTGMTFYANSIDQKKPICRFTNTLSNISKVEESYLTLQCIDTGSGLEDNVIEIGDLVINNPNIAEITRVSSPNKIDNGYSYVVSVKGLEYGTFNISLKDGAVADKFDLVNSKITTNDIMSLEYNPVEIWYIGANKRNDITAVLYKNSEVNGGSSNTYLLKMYGSGDMIDFTSSLNSGGYWLYAPWYASFRFFITDVIISDGITNVGNYAFYQMNSLTDMRLSKDTKRIGDYAFNQSAITEIDLAELTKLEHIGKYAFQNLGISEIVIPNSVITIEDSAFAQTKIKKLELSSSSKLERIGESAFFGIDELERVILPNSIKTISSSAFAHAYNLSSVTIPSNSNLEAIGDYAFQENTSLEGLDLPDALQNLGSYAFENSGLKTVSFGSHIRSLPVNAFTDCHLLESIRVDEDNTNYKSIAGILYDENETTLLKCPSNYKESVINVPNTVSIIGSNAFTNTLQYVKNRTKITLNLPNNLSDINSTSNFNVFQIESFNIDDTNSNFKTIEGILYSSNGEILYKVPTLYSKSELSIVDTVKTISDYAMYENQTVEKVVVPESVKSIGNYAFYSYDLTNGIKNLYLNTYDDVYLGSSALDIYDIELNKGSNVVKNIYVERAGVSALLLKEDYIDNKHIKVIEELYPIISAKKNSFDANYLESNIIISTYFNTSYNGSYECISNIDGKVTDTSTLSLVEHTITCTVKNENNKSASAQVKINIINDTLLENKTYKTGDNVSYFDKDWVVVKDNGQDVTLVLKSNMTTGAFGSNTTYVGSTVFNYLNGTAIDNLNLTRAINAGSLVSAGTHESKPYYLRLLSRDELSSSIPLGSTSQGSLYWTYDTASNGLYLGNEKGLLAEEYFTTSKRGNKNLYAHTYDTYLTKFGGDGSYNTVATTNNWWRDNSPSVLIASPGVSSITYYNSSSSTAGSGCETLKEITLTKCHTDWSNSGRAYWYYGPYRNNNSTADLDNYLNTSKLSDSRSQNICVSGQSSTTKVYYAEDYLQCDLPIIAVSSDYEEAVVTVAIDQVTYYIPSGNRVTAVIGYRPVIVVKKA